MPPAIVRPLGRGRDVIGRNPTLPIIRFEPLDCSAVQTPPSHRDFRKLDT